MPAQLNNIEMQWKALRRRRRAAGIWRFTMFAGREGGGYTRLLAWTTPCGPPLSIIVDCDYYTITPWLIEY